MQATFSVFLPAKVLEKLLFVETIQFKVNNLTVDIILKVNTLQWNLNYI